jgi:hypothetical protein
MFKSPFGFKQPYCGKGLCWEQINIPQTEKRFSLAKKSSPAGKLEAKKPPPNKGRRLLLTFE